MVGTSLNPRNQFVLVECLYEFMSATKLQHTLHLSVKNQLVQAISTMQKITERQPEETPIDHQPEETPIDRQPEEAPLKTQEVYIGHVQSSLRVIFNHESRPLVAVADLKMFTNPEIRRGKWNNITQRSLLDEMGVVSYVGRKLRLAYTSRWRNNSVIKIRPQFIPITDILKLLNQLGVSHVMTSSMQAHLVQHLDRLSPPRKRAPLRQNKEDDDDDDAKLGREIREEAIERCMKKPRIQEAAMTRIMDEIRQKMFGQ